MSTRWVLTFAAAALCASCLNTGEFGGEGADCDEELLCAVDFSCVDGTCTAVSDVPDMGNDIVDANVGPDTSTPDTGEGEPDTGDDVGVDMPTPPCDDACSGATPVCDEDTDTCVPCLTDTDCTDGVCLAGATTADNACVACRETADCTDGVCDTDTNTCVACLSDVDCTDPTAAKCELGATTADNACVACDDSGQCAGVPEAAICDSGTCIECRPATEETDCGTTFCSPATNECTQSVFGTAAGCDECTSDVDCAAGFRCFAMDFQGALHGNYCMPLLPVDQMECSRTYGAYSDPRVTVDGATAPRVCHVNEQLTTCEAVGEFATSCTTDDDCVAPGSTCRSVGPAMRCTYACALPEDCRQGTNCGGPMGDEYCGGQ